MLGDLIKEEEQELPVVLSFCAMEPSLERLLSDIVVHVATVLLSLWLDVGLVTPLAVTVTDPLELKVWDIILYYMHYCHHITIHYSTGTIFANHAR